MNSTTIDNFGPIKFHTFEISWVVATTIIKVFNLCHVVRYSFENAIMYLRSLSSLTTHL